MGLDLRDPRHQKFLLGLLVALGAGFAFYQYVLVPREGEIAARETRHAHLSAHVDRARREVERTDLAVLRGRLAAMERELRRAEDLLPTEAEVPGLLERVERTAMRSGVLSVLFEPQPSRPAQGYTEQMYKVSVRGGYHDVGAFLTRIASLERILRPADLGLSVVRVADPVERDMVKADFLMSTFTLGGTPPPADGTPKGAEDAS